MEEGDAFVMNASTWVEIVSTLYLEYWVVLGKTGWPDAELGAGKANTPVMRDWRESRFGLSGSPQNYRVKRLSACGGCLGDYRR